MNTERTIRGVMSCATMAVALWAVEPVAAMRQAVEPAPMGPDPAVVQLLGKAATYLDAYQKDFSAIVAEEDYVQTSTGRTVRRELKSDVMEINLGGAAFAQFRDVYEVDGKKVRDHDARLEKLFLHPTASTLAQASQIAGESSRYNIGMSRTTNVPTMALTYLLKPFQFRSLFDAPVSEAIDGHVVSAVNFREVFYPTLIRDRSIYDVPTSGRFWIDPETGRIVRTELRCIVPQKDKQVINGTTTVSYALEPSHNLMVPVEMQEEWARGKDRDRGRALYTNFRTFTVDVQAVKRGGGGGGGGA